MGGRSSKQKAEINSSPKDKKGKKKKSKKEATSNGDAGIEADQQEIETTTDESKKELEEVPATEPAANVDEDSATGSGGVTAPASPDTLQDSVQQQSSITDISIAKDKDVGEISVTFNWPHAGKDVSISGSYNQWGDPTPLTEKEGIFELTYKLPVGEHHYKYLVDGEWTFDKDKPTTELEGHDKVNIIVVSATDTNK